MRELNSSHFCVMAVGTLGLEQAPPLDALYRDFSSIATVDASRNGGTLDISDNLLDRRLTGEYETVPNHSIAIAVDPIALITTECITVTSAMRKNTRWAQSSVSAILGGPIPKHLHDTGDSSRTEVSNTQSRRQSGHIALSESSTVNEDESLASRWGLRRKKGKSLNANPLMSAFARLRSDLRGCTGQES